MQIRKIIKSKIFKRTSIGFLTFIVLYSLYVIKTVKGIDIDPQLSAPKAFHYIPNLIEKIIKDS